MDKPIHKREHNNCQQLIKKSHGRSLLDSYIRKATSTLCKGKGHCIRNVSVLQKQMLFACHRSQISGSVLCSLVNSFIPQHINSQGKNIYKLEYISLEEVKSVPFQQ